MSSTERLRKNDKHRQQCDTISKRMKEKAVPLSVVVVEPPQPALPSRRSKQWKFHFTITITLPTPALFTRKHRTQSHDVPPQRDTPLMHQTRRRNIQRKAGLTSPSRAHGNDRLKCGIQTESSVAKPTSDSTPCSASSMTKVRFKSQHMTAHQHEQHHKLDNHQSPFPSHQEFRRRGIMCPLCRNETVESRWQGREEWLRYAGISARRCPRCLHRFYKEPLVLRPMHRLLNVRNNVGITRPSRSKQRRR